MGDSVAHATEVYYWREDQRERDASGRTGTMHAKCAVADRSSLLVSSANLTDFALNLNMELGLLIRGGNAGREVAEHYDSLIRRNILAARSIEEN